MENKTVKPVKKPVLARKFWGVVLSNKMNKTVVVNVETTKINRLYHKRYKVSRKYKVHDEKNEYQLGDIVNFVECRPLSRDKRWRVTGKVTK